MQKRKIWTFLAVAFASACSGGGAGGGQSPPPAGQAELTAPAGNLESSPGPNAVPGLSSDEDDKKGASTPAAAWGEEDGIHTLVWDDLMPEGGSDALDQQYADFYATLEQRYQANATMLADAAPYAQIPEGSSLDYMPQLGTFDTVKDLDGLHIRIPGFVVPLDFDEGKRQTEFLFVPYMGACIHTPPPPPNQIIFVVAEPPIKVDDIWVPYWAEGQLSASVHESDLGDAAYTLRLERLTHYDAE